MKEYKYQFSNIPVGDHFLLADGSKWVRVHRPDGFNAKAVGPKMVSGWPDINGSVDLYAQLSDDCPVVPVDSTVDCGGKFIA